MVAAAFKETEPRAIIEAGLRVVPPKSRLANAVRFVIALHAEERDWERAVDRLVEHVGSYHWVHTVNNAALVAAALLYGEGDYERSICNVVMGGWDTDSNGATVGSIIGTMLGKQALPAKWIAPLNNRIRSSLKGFDHSSLDALAERTMRLAQHEAHS